MVSGERVRKAVNESLRRLRVDYLDLMLVQWPGLRTLDFTDERHAYYRRVAWTELEQCYKYVVQIYKYMRINYWVLAGENGHLWRLFLYGETEIVTNVYPFKFDWIAVDWEFMIPWNLNT